MFQSNSNLFYDAILVRGPERFWMW